MRLWSIPDPTPTNKNPYKKKKKKNKQKKKKKKKPQKKNPTNFEQKTTTHANLVGKNNSCITSRHIHVPNPKSISLKDFYKKFGNFRKEQ